MVLSREEIIAAIAARRKSVETINVPEWGGTVCVRRLSAADAETTGLTNDEQGPEMVTKVLAASLTDEEGVPLFTDKDAKALAQTDMAVAARVFAECVRINGLMSDDLEAAVQAFTSAQPDISSSS